MAIFIAWAFLVGSGKAIAVFTDYDKTGGQNLLQCTYFNGFTFKTVGIAELTTVSDKTACPLFIENLDLAGWTPI